MTETFNENVKIRGNQDVPQLLVQGSFTQNEPLQIWETNTGDGRFQIGSFSSGAMSTTKALVEGHRDAGNTELPTR